MTITTFTSVVITYVCVELATVVPKRATARTSAIGADSSSAARARLIRAHRLAAAAREQARRPHQQHEDHGGEEERGQVLALVGRQGTAEEAGREPDREAAERGRNESVHPAEHDAGEDEDRVAQGEVGCH